MVRGVSEKSTLNKLDLSSTPAISHTLQKSSCHIALAVNSMCGHPKGVDR